MNAKRENTPIVCAQAAVGDCGEADPGNQAMASLGSSPGAKAASNTRRAANPLKNPNAEKGKLPV
jgi:hypothetical protein